jgi:SAM-dependent methyltransferase
MTRAMPDRPSGPHAARPEGTSGAGALPLLYTDLADWWPLLSTPGDYAEEAAFYRRTIRSASGIPVRTILELGSGGGNNASHLKSHFDLTLVDLAPGMVSVSRALNPECEHHVGDMRGIRLGRTFDAVFIHDAIMYLTIEEDLRQAAATARAHCRPGGVVLLAPDHTRETFRPSTKHGGHDGDGRSLRYLEWTWDPDPDDTTVLTAFAYILREKDQAPRVLEDLHTMGIFPHDLWLRILTDAGLSVRALPFEHSEIEPGSCDVFVGVLAGD